jgi:hypothetical protein
MRGRLHNSMPGYAPLDAMSSDGEAAAFAGTMNNDGDKLHSVEAFRHRAHSLCERRAMHCMVEASFVMIPYMLSGPGAQ